MKLPLYVFTGLFLFFSCAVDSDPSEDLSNQSDGSQNESNTEEDTMDNPTVCSADEYVVANECTPCPPGTTSVGGDDVLGPDTACESILCFGNEHVSSNACVPCPIGTINATIDSAIGPDTTCEAILCREGQFVSSNACMNCPIGMTHPPGDDATGPDTICEAILCAENQYVSSNACFNCPRGTDNPSGDDATGPDTACEVTFCSNNEHVDRNECATCPAGTTNEAGDDATGADTECELNLCFEDEFVENNTCTPCPTGLANAEGDNPTGADTVCLEIGMDDCSIVLGVTCPEFEEAYIKASNTDRSDSFGFSLALDGDTLVVGAPGEDSNATGIDGNQSNNSESSAGAVYVFTRSGVTWSQQAYIKASNADFAASFGRSVALDGNTLAVGASRERSNATGVDGDQSGTSLGSAGAVYMFTRSGTTWTQEAYIKASNTGAGDAFGAAVALDGDTLAVGAPGEDSNAVGIDGNQGDNTGSQAGAVYVFTRNGTTWSQEAYVKASNTDGRDQDAHDRFGSRLALEGNTLAVGAPGEESNATGINGDESNNLFTDAGAVYVFTRSESTWIQEAYIKASNTDRNDLFGASVALDGNTLAVGAPGEDSFARRIDGDQNDNRVSASGAVYVFTRSDATWNQDAYVKANAWPNDVFGSSVALDGDMLAVGVVGESSSATGINGDQSDYFTGGAGALYLYSRSGSTWSQHAFIKASNTGARDGFGAAVALDGGTLVVSATGEDSNATGINGDQSDNRVAESGAVYVRRIIP